MPSTPRLILIIALIAGAVAWAVYAQQDLVLSHYDAKGHLVVARRVIDNITPGWQQIGAVWLPLPHLIQMLPVQLDVLYRTGAFASMVSIGSFAAAAWAAARLVLAITGSALGAFIAGALLVLNPNLLYLQSTPMTEPLLLGVTFVSTLWLYEWLEGVEARHAAPLQTHSVPLHTNPPLKLGIALFAAAWTRYEAWLIITAAFAASALVLWRAGVSRRDATRALARLAASPLAALLLFLLISRITVGAWFVAGGFYVPDPGYDGLFWRSLVAVWWGTHQLSGYVIETTALGTAVILALRARRGPTAPVVTLSLFAAAVLPFYAFYEGHPFRIRYMIPVMAACALFCGMGVGSISRVGRAAAKPTDEGSGPPGEADKARPPAWALAVLLIASSLIESPPLSGTQPMLEEARWDVPRSRERQAVTDCLAPQYNGEKVLASMGSLAHYMQELSREGFDIADFVHEGNGVIWMLAMETGPSPHAGWMLVEEQAEGGDVLAQRIRDDATFIDGMTRVCEGGGVALYRRTS